MDAGYSSSIFVVSDQISGLQLTLNFKLFNCYVHIPAFKMPIMQVWQLIHQGVYVIFFSLQDAYLYLPVVQ